jgi:hypothetical protein
LRKEYNYIYKDMIYKWNVIDIGFAKELMTSYINGSKDFDGMVLEVQNLSNVLDDTGNRYFLDRYTDRTKYSSYDSNQKFLTTMGLEHINKEACLANWVVLSEMKKTTPEPIDLKGFKSSSDLSSKLAKAVGNLTSDPFEKKMIGKLLGKMELAVDSLVSTDPQYQFMPITDLEVWAKLWKFVILGEPMLTGMDTTTSGFWFINEGGEFKRIHEKSDWNNPKKYLRIRSIDFKDYEDEVKRVLEGHPISLDQGTELINII